MTSDSAAVLERFLRTVIILIGVTISTLSSSQSHQAGASLLKGGVMTICNTGALATGGHGTALGMASNYDDNDGCDDISNTVQCFNYLLRYGVLWSKELPFDCMSISNQQQQPHINNNISLHKNYFKTAKKKRNQSLQCNEY